MPSFHPSIPVLRIFDEAKASEFYVDFLGFRFDWKNGGGEMMISDPFSNRLVFWESV